MPNVPTYDTAVQKRALPTTAVNPDVSPEAFGAPGQAAEKFNQAAHVAGSVLEEYSKDQKRRADRTFTLEKDSDSAEFFTELDQGVRAAKGRDAAGAFDEAVPQYEEFRDKLLGSANNDDQRYQVDRLLRQRWESFRRSSRVHEANEFEKYAAEQTDRAFKNADNDAARVADQIAIPALRSGAEFEIESAVEKKLSLLRQFARDNGKESETPGVDTEWMKAESLKATSDAYDGVVERLIANKRDLDARSFYEQRKEFFTPDARTRIERTLHVANTLAESQKIAGEVFSQYSGNMTVALAKAREAAPEGDIRKSTIDELHLRFSEKEHAERVQKENVSKAATDYVRRGQDIPDSLVSQMDSGEHSRLMEYKKRLFGRDPIVTDRSLIHELQEQSSNPETRGDFLKRNLLQDGLLRLSDSDYQEWEKTQKAMRAKDPAIEAKLDTFRERGQIENNTLLSNGFDPTPDWKNQRMSKAVTTFRTLMDERLRTKARATGRPPTPEDIQDTADRLMIEGKTKDGWLGFFEGRKRAFQLEGGETLHIDVKDIPMAQRRKVEAALIEAKIPVNDATILDRYLKTVNR